MWHSVMLLLQTLNALRACCWVPSSGATLPAILLPESLQQAVTNNDVVSQRLTRSHTKRWELVDCSVESIAETSISSSCPRERRAQEQCPRGTALASFSLSLQSPGVPWQLLFRAFSARQGSLGCMRTRPLFYACPTKAKAGRRSGILARVAFADPPGTCRVTVNANNDGADLRICPSALMR